MFLRRLLFIFLASFQVLSVLAQNADREIEGMLRQLPLERGVPKAKLLFNIAYQYTYKYDGYLSPFDARRNSIAIHDYRKFYFYLRKAYDESINQGYSEGVIQGRIELAVFEYAQDVYRKKLQELVNALKQGDPKLYGLACLRYSNHVGFDSSIYYRKAALSCYEKADYQEGILEASSSLTEIFISKYQFENAFSYCEKALKSGLYFADTWWGQTRLRKAYLSMAEIYAQAGDNKTSFKYLLFARKIEETAKLNNLSEIYSSLVYSQNGQLDSAQHYLRRTVSFNGPEFDLIRGEIYLNLRDYESALFHLKAAEDPIRGQASMVFIPRLLIDLAHCYLYKNNLYQSLFYIKMAMELAEPTRLKHIIAEACKLLAKFYEIRSMHDSSAVYYKKYAELKDSLNNRQLVWQMNNRLYYFERAAEDQKRNNEILILQKNNIIARQIIAQNQHIQKEKQFQYEILEQQNKLKEQQLERDSLLNLDKARKILALTKENELANKLLRKNLVLRNTILCTMGIIIIAAVLIALNLSLRKKNEKLKRIQAEDKFHVQQLEAERKQVDLEMQALRAQMNPHFIFNSLTSINAFIVKHKSEEASDYLTRFARLIRMVLINSGKKMITLDEELSMLRLYLDMEKLRCNNIFEYEIKIDEDLNNERVFLPPLLFQPFCENAIWHGLMPKQSSGNLKISISRKNNDIVCEISDNGIGRKKSSELKSNNKYPSLGIQITRNRLALFNNNGLSNVVEMYDNTADSTGTTVIIKLNRDESLKILA